MTIIRVKLSVHLWQHHMVELLTHLWYSPHQFDLLALTVLSDLDSFTLMMVILLYDQKLGLLITTFNKDK